MRKLSFVMQQINYFLATQPLASKGCSILRCRDEVDAEGDVVGNSSEGVGCQVESVVLLKIQHQRPPALLEDGALTARVEGPVLALLDPPIVLVKVDPVLLAAAHSAVQVPGDLIKS